MKLVKKVYTSTSVNLSFIYAVVLDGLKTTHVFRLDSNNTAIVLDPEKQKAIESSKYFTSGLLKLKQESNPTVEEVATYNKQYKKESRVIELAKTRPDIADKVMETAQIKVVDADFKTAEEIITDELEKANQDLPTSTVIESDQPSGNSTVEIEYPEVVNIQQAKEVLRKEYGVAFQKLGSPENIKKNAELVGAVFPNLEV